MKGKIVNLTLRIIIGVAFLLSLLMWFSVQYDFAGITFYMFSVKGTHLAFGYIEGYQGFLAFGFPPFFAFVASMLSVIAIFIKEPSKAYLYVANVVLAFLSIIIYIATYFNIMHRFGNVLWTASFWVTFTLYFIALTVSTYFVVSYLINKRKLTLNQKN